MKRYLREETSPRWISSYQFPPPERRLSAREGKPSLLILPFIGHSFQAGSCTVELEISIAALFEDGLRKLIETGHAPASSREWYCGRAYALGYGMAATVAG